MDTTRSERQTGGRAKEGAVHSIGRMERGFLKEVALEFSQKGRMSCHQPKQVVRGIVDGRNSSSKGVCRLIDPCPLYTWGGNSLRSRPAHAHLDQHIPPPPHPLQAQHPVPSPLCSPALPSVPSHTSWARRGSAHGCLLSSRGWLWSWWSLLRRRGSGKRAAAGPVLAPHLWEVVGPSL